MKKRQRNKPRPSNIGRRTGVDVVQGKKIRRQDDGTDVFDDYWTDNESIYSNQTTQSSPDKTTSDKILENVPILNRDSVSYRNAPRSSMKKTLNGEYEDHTGYFRPEHLKRSEVSRRKLHFSEEIGRRTGVDVVQGKKIRRRDDGTDVYEDYWTDSDLIDSSQTIKSVYSPVKTRSEEVSENVSIFDRDSVSFMKTPRSSMKETRNQGSEDHDGYSSPEQSKRSEVSRKKSHFCEDVENSAIARSKMTQTSHLLDETESTPSKNRMHEKSWKSNGADLSDSKVNSSARKSPKMLSNSSQTPNRRESLPSSRAARVSLSSKMESGKKAKDKRNSRVMTRTSHSLDETKSSPFRNRTYTHKTSYSKGAGKNKTDSSDSESSPVKTSSILSETSHEPNRREDLPSSRDDTRAERVSLSSKMEYGIKAKEMRDLSVMTQTSHPLDATEGSPFKNRTYMPKRSYSNETEKNKADSSDSERNSPVETSRVLSETSHVSNRREYLPSSRNDTRGERVSLSSKMESEKKAKDKRNSRVMTRTSHPLDRTEGSPFRNRTYTPKTSYSKETEKNKANSSDSERISPVETSRVLSETSHVSNKRRDTRAARVSLSSKTEYVKKAKDKRNSRVMTRNSHPLSRTEGSPFKNMANSCDSERNFSVERCSGVSSKTFSSSNSKKEVNKRNSSLRRPPQYAAKSSEVLNQKENIPSGNRRSVNKTEILISGQRENELKEEAKRKSSMGRSPIAIKRKMIQTPDALENSLSKTSCVQNRWEEENENNFSGKKSQHHTAKSSEVLNLKRNVSSRSVNRSGILVSCQKENDQDENNQKSSTEKSPRASVSSTIQTSDHLENRQVSSTASQDALQENASSPCKGLRRSSRYRRPPLASWRNERFKFVKASAEKEYECVGVEEGQPEDDFAFRTLKRRQSKVRKRKIVAWEKRKNVPKHIKKTPIINEKTEKIIELYLHRPFSSYEWTLPPNEDNPGYVISRTFKSRFMTFGFLEIAGHSMKDRQHSPQDNLHFVVVSGVVEAVINATSFTFQKGDSFIVPVGTFYSISNETSNKALLCFTSFRIPFFTYQEKD
ncbi:hypothetical protein AVEN_79958-1 [Araneus ventricosus]|uniref:Mif2/CENP-C cupin domain-containing protein n=1 Tax=Araneus ventricosus TaxID=182803 RepID=A0A4Y2H5S9_ARAVE|nr:hypothetical protein AVEN_79958-1 [Araneus ventricosus]